LSLKQVPTGRICPPPPKSGYVKAQCCLPSIYKLCGEQPQRAEGFLF
jgi:hypothetical protein